VARCSAREQAARQEEAAPAGAGSSPDRRRARAAAGVGADSCRAGAAALAPGGPRRRGTPGSGLGTVPADRDCDRSLHLFALGYVASADRSPALLGGGALVLVALLAWYLYRRFEVAQARARERR